MEMVLKVLYLLVCPLTFATIDLPRKDSCSLRYNHLHAYFDEISGRCFYFSNVEVIYLSTEPRNLAFPAERCSGDDYFYCCKTGQFARIDNAHIFYNIFMKFSQDSDYGHNTSFLVGLDRIDSDNYQFTFSNSDIDTYYTAWKPGKPDNSEMKCAVGHGDGIEDISCSSQTLYLCEDQDENTGCPLGFFQSLTTGMCYMIRDDKQTNFQTARRICYDNGADMYMPNSPEEMEVLGNFNLDKAFWIGSHEFPYNGFMTWINGHRMEWAVWASGQSNEDCTEVTTDGKLNRVSCHLNRYYACQRPKYRENERGGCPGDSWRYVETGRCYAWYPTETKNMSDAIQFCEDKGGFLAPSPPGYSTKFQKLISSFHTDTWYSGSVMEDSTLGSPLCELTTLQNSSVLSGAHCRSGYFYHEHLNTCYRIVNTQTKKWNDARADCQTVPGGDLIQVVSKDINDFVILSVTALTWLGASRHRSHFVWTKTNAPVSDFDTFWGRGEPNSRHENCLDIFVLNYYTIYRMWNNSRCWRRRNYICEHPVIENKE